jgi:hypothetical protein
MPAPPLTGLRIFESRLFLNFVLTAAAVDPPGVTIPEMVSVLGCCSRPSGAP